MNRRQLHLSEDNYIYQKTTTFIRTEQKTTTFIRRQPHLSEQNRRQLHLSEDNHIYQNRTEDVNDIYYDSDYDIFYI